METKKTRLARRTGAPRTTRGAARRRRLIDLSPEPAGTDGGSADEPARSEDPQERSSSQEFPRGEGPTGEGVRSDRATPKPTSGLPVIPMELSASPKPVEPCSRVMPSESEVAKGVAIRTPDANRTPADCQLTPGEGQMTKEVAICSPEVILSLAGPQGKLDESGEAMRVAKCIPDAELSPVELCPAESEAVKGAAICLPDTVSKTAEHGLVAGSTKHPGGGVRPSRVTQLRLDKFAFQSRSSSGLGHGTDLDGRGMSPLSSRPAVAFNVTASPEFSVSFVTPSERGMSPAGNVSAFHSSFSPPATPCSLMGTPNHHKENCRICGNWEPFRNEDSPSTPSRPLTYAEAARPDANNISTSNSRTSPARSIEEGNEVPVGSSNSPLLGQNIEVTIRSCPDKMVRDGETLHVVFPTPDLFSCPENRCNVKFKTATWTHTKLSLTRHLERAHKKRIRNSINWCKICSQKIGRKPSTHACLRNQVVTATDDSSAGWACPKCPFTCMSSKGSGNHEASHRRAEQEAEHNNILLPTPIRARRRRFPDRTFYRRNGNNSLTDPRSNEELLSENSTEEENLPPINIQQVSSGTEIEIEDPGLPEEQPGDHIEGILNCNHIQALDGDTNENNLPTVVVEPTTAEVQSADQVTPPAEIEEEGPLVAFIPHLEDIENKINNGEEVVWQDFENIEEEILHKIGIFVKLPEIRERTGHPPKTNTEDPKVIQRLYRRNRRRAVRLLTEGETEHCNIPKEDLTRHFTACFAERSFDHNVYNNNSTSQELDINPFTVEEVRRKLKSAENSAPGKDRITYKHWKAADPGCVILTKIFNICLASRKIPASWKSTRTVLIHKKGDREDIGNWRPISLGQTVYKLYTGCLAKRLSSWIADNNVLNHGQKGFLPFDGVFEHNFVLQHRIQEARTSGQDVCIASLDLTNAFGSIAHGAILEALQSAGTGSQFKEIVANLYEESYTSIATLEGDSDPIAIKAGVRQGCPLSGLLFNIAIDPLLTAVTPPEENFDPTQEENSQSQHSALAFADDILILDKTTAGLQTKIDALASIATRLSLQLNPEKCFTLHLSGKTPVGTRNTGFRVLGSPVKSLLDGDQARFLGKPIGFQIAHNKKELAEIMKLAEVLLSCKLAPWQRIDAVKSFLFPSLNFAMRTAQFGKSEWSKLDDIIKPLLKKTLNLPPEASNDYLYGNSHEGMIGMPLAAEDSDIARVDSAFKLLTSRDVIIRRLAWEDLERLVSRRLRRSALPQDVAEFLTGNTEGEFRTSDNPISSVWTSARTASRRLHTTWEISDERDCSILIDPKPITETSRSQVSRRIRTLRRKERSQRLISLKSQGKVMECVAAAPVSNHFLREGNFTRFADWRFVHKARLNLVPLNGHKPWDRTADQRCRRCGYRSETLCHVLCHCTTYSRLWNQRHNGVQARVVKAAAGRFHIWSQNQVIGNTHLRPDLVLAHGRSAIIVDVTIPFDDRLKAFDVARSKKLEKYAPVVDYLLKYFDTVETEAFIIGALGSWDPGNDRLMKRLCSRKYGVLMKKLCISDVIRCSRDLYTEFVSGKRQDLITIEPEASNGDVPACDPTEISAAVDL